MCRGMCRARGFDTVSKTYPDFGREGTDQRLAAIVGLDTALLLVVLDGLVPQQAYELDHALEELARGAAGRREDHNLRRVGEQTQSTTRRLVRSKGHDTHMHTDWGL